MLADYDFETTAEAALMGAVLASDGDIPSAVWLVEPEDFQDPKLARVFAAVKDLVNDGEAVDQLSMVHRIRSEDGGRASPWVNLLVAVETRGLPSTAKRWAHRVLRDSRRRQTQQALTEALGRSKGAGPKDDVLAGVLDAVARIPGDRVQSAAISLKDAAKEAFLDMEARHAGKIQPYKSTGLQTLDSVSGGLRDSELVIIAGRPSMGKSALVGHMLASMARQYRDKQFLFASLEMSRMIVSFRMLANESGVDLRRILGRPSPDDWPKLARAMNELTQMPIHICDKPGLTVAEIQMEARRIGNVGAVFVDYLQIAKAGKNTESRHLELGAIAKDLKRMAKSLDCPVVALSQLNRQVEQRSPPIPKLSDLRESGSIEEDADVVMLLYRDEYYNDDTNKPGIIDINVAKNRNFGTGHVELQWIGEYQRFADMRQRHAS